jgi:hypothetical protein
MKTELERMVCPGCGSPHEKGKFFSCQTPVLYPTWRGKLCLLRESHQALKVKIKKIKDEVEGDCDGSPDRSSLADMANAIMRIIEE